MGYLGIDFFFAVSGYVICLVAAKPSFLPLPFAIKRVFRLYPICWVAMACVAYLIAIEKYRQEPISHFLYSMTLLPQQGAPAHHVPNTFKAQGDHFHGLREPFSQPKFRPLHCAANGHRRVRVRDRKMDMAAIAITTCVGLYLALRVTLRFYFPPDT